MVIITNDKEIKLNMELSCIYQLPDENINGIRKYFLPDYQQLIEIVEKYFQKPLIFRIGDWYKGKERMVSKYLAS